jgi:N-methylhydantoinase A/oxoprolinase/acetone carboxylase beta subunit
MPPLANMCLNRPFTAQLPVATFQSGPVNSLRGAAVLCGLTNGIVLDIGGTTTDVGVIVDGLPRPAPRAVRFAGVQNRAS